MKGGEKMLSKKIILPVAVAVLGASLLFGVKETAQAQSGKNPYSGLVQQIAQKFGLDQAKVQSVVDEYKQQQKSQNQQNMQQREQDRLTKLVQEGKINDTQKQAILNKLASLRSKYNQADFKNLTADQRKQQLQAEQDEIKSWAKDQGIDPTYLMPFGGGRKMGGFRNKPTATPTP